MGLYQAYKWGWGCIRRITGHGVVSGVYVGMGLYREYNLRLGGIRRLKWDGAVAGV